MKRFAEGGSTMRSFARGLTRAAVAGALLVGAAGRARGEIVDEIVAKVNDEIITKSDLDSEEQATLEEIYRRFSGAELDAQVKKAKAQLLRNVIDRKVLLQNAPRLFDAAKMQDYFLQSFKEQQNIQSDKELEKMLAGEGMTLADWKKKLLEFFAPQQVIRAEVVDRVAVSEKDARAYYDAHQDAFAVPAEATIREIVIRAAPSDRAARRAAAEEVRAKAADPAADFAALAAASSDAGTKTNGGLLGTVKKGDLAAPLEEAAFSVPVGQVSPVIEADYGFHILKVDARTDAYVKPFDSVKTDVQSKLENEEIQKQTRIYLKKVWAETTIWISPKYESRLSPEDATQ
jgi:peptidyl-prolyl cis-trans isomerase SurA